MRVDNIEMLNETLNILEAGFYKKNNKKVKLKLSQDEMHESIVLLPDDVKNICDNSTIEKIFVMGRTGSFCVNEDSYTTAIKIKNNHPDEKVLVLNFANPVHPGGGVRNGARAQEEDLCRKSSLLLSLEDNNSKNYYNYNSKLNSNWGSDAIIMNPNVEIIKDSKGDLLDEMCKSGISVNELSTKKSRDTGIMKLVGHLNRMLPFLSDYYELPIIAS